MNPRAPWTWLGDHLAVDFVNTTIGREDERIDLIASPAEFAGWMEAEPAWLPEIASSEIDVDRVGAQRDATSRLVRAAALGQTLPGADVEAINAAVINGGVNRLLTGDIGSSRLVADRGLTAVLGVLAGATVDLLAREDLAAIAICEAPGCGQVFHRSRRDQRWCSPGCGNRARVDRHRHRNPQAQRGGRS